jgi:restriction system protein
MMGRRKSSLLEDIFEIGARLPWWMSVVVAAIAYLIFHSLAQTDPGVASSAKDAGSVVVRQLIKTMSYYAQIGVPALLLLGAAVSLLKSVKRARMYDSLSQPSRFSNRAPRDKLDTLSWRQFEELVHEYFLRKGFVVAETEQGPDGGVDLRLRKDGRTATVQCKHWRKKKVDVKTVREQLGVMTALGADEGFVVTSGVFTNDARDFARGQPITLIDGGELRGLMGIFAWDHVEERPPRREPSCPGCGSDMVLRTARKGRNAGGQFWGCSRFPDCRGIRQV